MAVIGKIQKNSLLLLIVIGLAMLAFIFTDFLKTGGTETERLSTATLHGEPIDENEYSELRDTYLTQEKNSYAYQQKEFTQADEVRVENQAFNDFVRNVLLNEEYEKLGITVTTEELNDMIHGKHIHPGVSQAPMFNGPTGFSRDSVRKYINSLEVEPDNEEARNQWLESRRNWKEFENKLKDARKANKYISLIKKGIFVNKIEAKDQYQALNNKKSVRYVVQRYADIPKTDFTVTDDEIKAYFDAHKNDPRYEQQEARDLEIVEFSVYPTNEDIEEIKGELEGLKEPFKLTQNNIGFVYQNSDSDFLSDSTRFSYGGDQMVLNPYSASYPKDADEIIQAAETGDIIGPFMTSNSEMAIAKVIDGTPTQRLAWVRHILIGSTSRSEERAKAIADSLVQVIKVNNNFAELVPLMSEDPGSKDKGGEYKWFKEGMMVPTFNDASFNGAIGKIQLVKTNYGYHIVEVLGRGDRKTPVLAVVTKKVKPSDNTLAMISDNIYEYIYTVNDTEGDSAFHKVALDSGKIVNSARVFLANDFVSGMTSSEGVMRFAFNKNATEGDISDPIFDGDKYAVVRIANVIEEGKPEFADVKEQMRNPALRDKQAAEYIAKMSGKNSLEEVAKLLPNGSVKNAEVTFGNDRVINGGLKEAALVGMLFTKIPVGSMTKPIQGEEGVYVFIVDKETPAPETTDYSAPASSLVLKRVGIAEARAINALREKADLVDNRRKIQFN